MERLAAEQPNRKMVLRATFHGRQYDYAVSTLCKYLRNLTQSQRAALFGVIEDSWCVKCGREPHAGDCKPVD